MGGGLITHYSSLVTKTRGGEVGSIRNEVFAVGSLVLNK
jgi:hypothetical protein